MNHNQINTLQEFLKSYTIAATVANASRNAQDQEAAQKLLNKINEIRLNLAINAAGREIFYQQWNIPQAADAQQIQNIWISKNDIMYVYIRGIANLDQVVNIRFVNQGSKEIAITRQAVSWQQLFADIQRAAPRGQQTLFDFAEPLRLTENQALNVGLQGQSAAAGQLFFHGVTVKQDLQEIAVNALKAEYLNDDGTTKYIPETQLVPLEFQWLNAAAGTLAVDAQGGNEIFSIKNDKSVLLTHVSTSASDARYSIFDEARNQTIADTVEARGIAANNLNAFTTFYELPEPHLLRRGDRLKLIGVNGSLITGAQQAANVLHNVCFKGITL